MMKHSDPLSIRAPAGYFWHGQGPHLLLLMALLPGAWFLAEPALGQGEWLGVESRLWFIAALVAPIVQQIGVALLWRAELCHRALTRTLGNASFIGRRPLF